jgi:hypothetical protein
LVLYQDMRHLVSHTLLAWYPDSMIGHTRPYT